MSATTPGPLPSKHIFLHEIPRQPSGSKVRFLGCVASYTTTTATLHLLEPASPNHYQAQLDVNVDIRLLLESVKPDDLRPGSWVNVIGYVNNNTAIRVATTGSTNTRRSESACTTSTVQAVVLWSAGAVKMGEYEVVLRRQREVEASSAAAAATTRAEFLRS